MKIHPVGEKLFHADRLTNGWMDMTKLIAFQNLANTATKGWTDQLDPKTMCKI
jgi:hypothetical protein